MPCRFSVACVPSPSSHLSSFNPPPTYPPTHLKKHRPAPANRPDAKDVVAVVLAGGASKNPLVATTAPAALSMGKRVFFTAATKCSSRDCCSVLSLPSLLSRPWLLAQRGRVVQLP